MQITEIVNQLKAVLPKYTQDFSNLVSVSSLTRSGSVVTATTSTAHGLIAGNKVLISGAKTPITVSSLTRNGIYALAITATKHNLIKPTETVEISGAVETDYNGTKTLVWTPPVVYIESITISGNTATVTTSKPHGLVDNANVQINISGVTPIEYNVTTALDSVPTDSTFTFTIYGVTEDGKSNYDGPMQMRQVLNAYTFIYEVSGSPTTPATGTITQIYEYKDGYNGYQTVVTAATTTTFTYAITSTPNSPAQGTIAAAVYINITGAVDYDRGREYFESQNEIDRKGKWIVVTVEDEIGNKNNYNKTDAISYNAKGVEIREQSYQNLNVYVFLPCGATNDALLYAATRDLAASYKPYIYKCLLGFSPSNPLVDSFYSKLTPVANGMVSFNASYYVHVYKLQASCWANQSDAIQPEDLFAFRTFAFNVLDNTTLQTDSTVMEINGEVDEANS